MQGVTEVLAYGTAVVVERAGIYALPRPPSFPRLRRSLCRSGGVRGVIPTEFPQAREEPSSEINQGNRGRIKILNPH